MALPRNGASRRHSDRRTCKAAYVVDSVLRDLGSQLSRRARRSLKRDHTDLVNLDIDPSQYSCPELFRRDYLAVSIMSKFPKLNLQINTEEAAMVKFREAEAACAATNRRLRAPYDTPTLGVSGDSLLETARRKIEGLLGDFDWDQAEPFFGFSTGASTRLRRSKGDAYYKFQGKPEVTPNCALLGICAIWSSPLWAAQMRDAYGSDPENWITVVPGNRITTVPKNAKTDRVIAIEPDLNMYIQRGIGGLLRRLLKTRGIDLDSQLYNQCAAREGSVTGKLATIDLRSASDTVSLALCERLLPPSWFEAISRCRCSSGVLPDGSVVNYQKVSSMGNGFTFELESLIFWALSSAILDSSGKSDHRLLVYGDDIVINSYAAGWLIELLKYAGFETNEKKTFIGGPFRESCGKHYFLGTDVTPFFVRGPIDDNARLFWFCNQVRRWAANWQSGPCDPTLKAGWERCVALLPSHLRSASVPDGVGDGGLIGTFAEVAPPLIGGMWRLRVLVEGSGRETEVFDSPSLIRCLSSIRTRGEGHRLVLRVARDLGPYNPIGSRTGGATALVVDTNKKWFKWSYLNLSRWEDTPYWV